MRELDIGEVVKRSGVPASTLRYYEQLGLLQAVGRRGLRRQYDEQVLERLALIGLGQAALDIQGHLQDEGERPQRGEQRRGQRAEIIASGNVDVGVRLELAFIDVGVHVRGTITREEP